MYKMLALQGHNFPLVHTSMFSFSTTQQLLSLMVMGEKSISMHAEGEAAGYNNTNPMRALFLHLYAYYTKTGHALHMAMRYLTQVAFLLIRVAFFYFLMNICTTSVISITARLTHLPERPRKSFAASTTMANASLPTVGPTPEMWG